MGGGGREGGAHSRCRSTFAIRDTLLVVTPPPSFSCTALWPSQLVAKYTAAGIKYYLNPRTNEVQWSPSKGQRRRPSAGGGGADQSFGGTSRGGGRLPRGWERRETRTGRAYFVNHEQRFCLFFVFVCVHVYVRACVCVRVCVFVLFSFFFFFFFFSSSLGLCNKLNVGPCTVGPLFFLARKVFVNNQVELVS